MTKPLVTQDESLDVTVRRTPRWRMGMTARTVLVTAAVAALAVIIAGLVSYPLVRGSAEGTARSDLALLADLTASSLNEEARHGDEHGPHLPPSLIKLLNDERVSGYIVVAGATPPPGATPADVSAVLAGAKVSATSSTTEGTVFVEGRPLDDGSGVLLIQPADVASDPAGDIIERMGIALLVGLAIAVLLALFLSARVTRPLRRAADAANRLSAGERDVRLVPAGPAEVAEIADSLNRLSAALEVSEGRQREFLMSVSHELRTPLTAVRGYAEALADGVIPPDEVEATGATVQAEADRLDRLVTDLLALARLGAVDFPVSMTSIDLTELGRDAAEVWRTRSERNGVDFRIEIPDHPIYITTDPLRVRQIVDNLAENALRVTPSGAPLVLAIRQQGTDAVVELRDGGPGLDPSDLAVAFEPGVLHERYSGIRKVGSGLGLALVGRLARLLGGQAQADLSPEGGACFRVILPNATPGWPTSSLTS